MRDFVPATTTREPGTPGGAPVQPTFFIDVLGDSLGVLTADGLTEAFADKPEIAIADKSREASGLVRDDYYDWPKAARDLATGKDHVDFVVVMLGINDLQPLQRRRRHARSLERSLARALRPTGRGDRGPVPGRAHSRRLGRPAADAHRPRQRPGGQAQRNLQGTRGKGRRQIYRHLGRFRRPERPIRRLRANVDGQNVKLRAADGILLTKAGSRKVAHFLEAEIKRVFEKNKPQNETATLPPDIEQAAGDINAQIRREMGAPEEPAGPGSPARLEPPKPLAGPILSLTARPTSPGGALAAREATPAERTRKRSRACFASASPSIRAPGRADDFSWPRL